MMKRSWAAWAAAFSTTAVGCGTLLGFDTDYYPVSEGAGGAGGAGSAGGAQGSGGAGGAEAACKAGDKRCSGETPEGCDDKGQWQSGAACSAETELCVAGACAALPPSCVKLPRTCGLKGDESCCASAAVPGGTFNRSNDPSAPATVSDFRLDRFEITVGRFRKFVEAYPGSRPMEGAGAHPKIAGSGWSAAWDVNLPADQAALRAVVATCDPPPSGVCDFTWTDKEGLNENLPMNSLSWYEALAFCAWDGGRLPTEAEWNYATAGGSEQRGYPWGSATLDRTHAVYDCTGDGSSSMKCAPTDILPVGSKPEGDGRFGQADLAGSMFEWNLDWYTNSYCEPCVDCECVDPDCTQCTPAGSFRVLRGGSWSSEEADLLSSNGAHNTNNAKTNRLFGTPTRRFEYVGARCARNP